MVGFVWYRTSLALEMCLSRSGCGLRLISWLRDGDKREVRKGGGRTRRRKEKKRNERDGLDDEGVRRRRWLDVLELDRSLVSDVGSEDVEYEGDGSLGDAEQTESVWKACEGRRLGG